MLAYNPVKPIIEIKKCSGIFYFYVEGSVFVNMITSNIPEERKPQPHCLKQTSKLASYFQLIKISRF
jgi:hypothetical protein